MTENNSINKTVRQRQALIATLVAAPVFIWLIWPDADEETAPTAPQGVDILRVDRTTSAQDKWQALAEGDLASLEKRLEAVEVEKTQLADQLADLEEALAKSGAAGAAKTGRRKPGGKPGGRGTTVGPEAREQVPPPSTFSSPVPSLDPPTGSADPTSAVPPTVAGGASGAAVPAAPVAVLQTFKLASRDTDTGRGLYDTENYIPAGAHAPGVVIAGADASAGVSGQAETRPVVIRITGEAVGAADAKGKTLRHDLTGCIVTASARGELSSERVFVRLQEMTCELNGMQRVASVRGYLAGTGRAGIRGDVVMRDADLVTKSFLSGLASGFGEGAAEAYKPPEALLQGEAAYLRPEEERLRDAAKGGIGEGIGAAGDRLSEYFINRAEQYQPVITLKAGTLVEVVFLEGVRFADDGAVVANNKPNEETP